MRLICQLLPFLLFVFLLSGAGSAQAQQEPTCLISPKGICPVNLGMSLRQARQAMPQARFVRTSDGDGVALVGVRVGKQDLMVIYAGEDDPEAVIDWSKKIEHIETFHAGCRMANGVGPGMRIATVERQLGKVRQISLSEIESREYVEFENQPKNFQFRLDYKGIFPNGSRITKKFQPDAKILAVGVSLEKR